ncbi:MAG: InlB B-repeat-containing protein, partial [Candidatus Fimimonas sp.]
MKKRVLLILAATLVICLLAACQPVVEAPTITFDAQNGTAPVEIKFDENFAMPAAPANGEMVFAGWFADKECTTPWQLPETLAENVTVYAKWEEPVDDSVYVHFDAQNGANPIVVKFDDKFAMPTPTNGDKVFAGWFADKECTTPWQIPQSLEADVTVYAKWDEPHVHDFGDSYFLFVQCADPECKVTGRASSTDEVKKLFVYNFTQESLDNIQNDFDVLDQSIANGQDYDAFENAFIVVEDDVNYLVEQYQYAYFFYYAFNSEQYKADYDFVSQFYNTCVSRYYGLYRAIYESALKDAFYEGWSEEDVRQALILSDSYGDSQYVELKSQIDEVVDRYYDLSNTEFTSAQMSALYAELVPLNNSLARLAGYDNYMEYAYASRYERDYTPSDVAVMRDFVKQYIVPAFDRLGSVLRGLSISSNAETSIYNAISGASVFGDNSATKKAVPYLGNYLQEMTSDEFNQPIDFFATTNDIFKDGNYYLGSKNGAFTYYIPAQDTSMLYFGDTKNSS